jgi:hypothetical protein
MVTRRTAEDILGAKRQTGQESRNVPLRGRYHRIREFLVFDGDIDYSDEKRLAETSSRVSWKVAIFI